MIKAGDILEYSYNGTTYIRQVQECWNDLYVPVDDNSLVIIDFVFVKRILSLEKFEKESIKFARLNKEDLK